MTDEIDFDTPEEDELVKPRNKFVNEFVRLSKEVVVRCKSASILTEPTEIKDSLDRLAIHLPAGREKKEFLIRDRQSAKLLLRIPFEKIQCLNAYRAYCSYEEGFIEAALDVGRRFPTGLIYSRLEKLEGSTTSLSKNGEAVTVLIRPENEQLGNARIMIGPASETFTVLEILRIGKMFVERMPTAKSRPLTIRIEGLSLSRHDQAVSILEKIANSILFQIDLLLGFPLYLAIESNNRYYRYLGGNKEKGNLVFPKYQYDTEAMSLYWYAKTATGMPLLQYLAYYQVVEFYFPVYAEKATHEIARRILKDPTFNPNQEANISQLLGALKPFLAKGGYGDEKAALIAAIKECISSQELRDFINQDGNRVDFFKTKYQATASSKISFDRENVDILLETANRVYEIRCKIVHTKSTESGQSADLMLPFSKEAQQLNFDIELMQFIARKVLIASSTPIAF